MSRPEQLSGDSEDAVPRGRFVHLDVLSAYSAWCSPSTPEQYVQTLARQYPVTPGSTEQPRPALAIADYGLHSAVRTAVACERAGVDHIVGLRVRVVPERAYCVERAKTNSHFDTAESRWQTQLDGREVSVGMSRRPR